MSDLAIAWTGAHSYVIGSPSEEGDDDEYYVDLSKIGTPNQTCTCEHGQHNPASTATCKHVRAAIEAHDGQPDLERFAFEQLADLIVTSHETLSGAQRVLADVAAQQTATDSTTDENASSDGSSSADGGSVVDRSIDPTDEQEEILSDVEGWIAQAAGFAGFDPSIVDAEWAEADGTPGVAFDTAPFAGGYHDGDSWQDKDGFDEERETFRDTMKNQDEVEWYGEPDYDNFVPATSVEELVG